MNLKTAVGRMQKNKHKIDAKGKNEMATGIVKIDTEQYSRRTLELKSLAETLSVKDASSCLEAKKAQQEIRLEVKVRKTVLDPFVLMAKKNLDDAKDERARWIDPLEAIDSALSQKVKEFERIEREFAASEERRINEENRIKAQQQAEAERKERERIAAEERKAREKELEAARKAGDINKREAERLKKEAAAAEERERIRAAEDAKIQAANVQTVTVAPSIPTVAGVPSRRNYKARVIDASRVPDQYWIIDEQALGAEAREAKKVGEIIPGVEFYED
jgi:hypothetical protein